MREKILVVDDNKDLRELAKTILKTQEYQVTLAKDGEEALDIFDWLSPDLIISDISMPKMNGFAFLEAVRSRKEGAAVPFLFLSAYSQRANLSQARHLAVDDYLFKPFDAQELLDAVRVRLDRRSAVQIFDTHEAHLQTVLLMANTIEARDPYTHQHIYRVRKIALLFGKTLAWSEASLTILEFGSILHDIGKIVVPKKILNKRGPFTEEEWEIMRQHPEVGAKMLEGVTHLKPAIPFVLAHHERWDGKGYPYGLKGEKIPLEGRVMSIVDVYEALTCDRPYHKKCSKETALAMIKEKSGKHFDPFLVQKFLTITDKLP
jgi:putative two-component system response regulator